MQSLVCAAGVDEPALGAAAGLGRWFVGDGFCRFVEISRGGGGSTTRQPQCTEPCQCVSGQPCAYHVDLQGQMQPLKCLAALVKPALDAAAGLGRWFVGVAVLPFSRVLVEQELRNNHSAQSPASV